MSQHPCGSVSERWETRPAPQSSRWLPLGIWARAWVLSFLFKYHLESWASGHWIQNQPSLLPRGQVSTGLQQASAGPMPWGQCEAFGWD